MRPCPYLYNRPYLYACGGGPFFGACDQLRRDNYYRGQLQSIDQRLINIGSMGYNAPYAYNNIGRY